MPRAQPGAVVFETARGQPGCLASNPNLQEIERGLTDRLRKQS